MFQLKGKLHEKSDTVQVSEKFKKREFVLFVPNEQNEKYSDLIKFELALDGCTLLDKVNVGDELSVKFVVNGRKWEKDGKVNYFNSLKCLGMDVTDKTGKTMTVTNEMANVGVPSGGQQQYASAPPTDDDDPLPF